jgi:hypothetical protein
MAASSMGNVLGHRNLQSTARYTALHRIGLRGSGRISTPAPARCAAAYPPVSILSSLSHTMQT